MSSFSDASLAANRWIEAHPNVVSLIYSDESEQRMYFTTEQRGGGGGGGGGSSFDIQLQTGDHRIAWVGCDGRSCHDGLVVTMLHALFLWQNSRFLIDPHLYTKFRENSTRMAQDT